MTHPIAVVTGAGAGIGRAVVRMLAEAGCDIALLGRNADRLSDAAAELDGHHVRVATYVADVTSEQALEDAADRIETELGPIAIWINAAGAAAIGAVSDLAADDIVQSMRVTYLGTVLGTRAALSRMRRRGRGRIINLGLMPQLRGLPLHAAGNAAHAAIEAFSDSLRPELIAYGDRIDVTVVHLPSINTPRLGWSRNRTGHALRPYATPYEPEAAALAIVRAAFGGQRDIWLGLRGAHHGILTALLPGMRDRWLARSAISAQVDRHEDLQADAPDTLLESPAGAFAAHGAFETVGFRSERAQPAIVTPGLRLGLIAVVAALSTWLLRRRR